jgi:predicted nucleic acid-binding Zn ribbon protein
MPCKHRVVFHFNMLYRRKIEYTCRNCGAPVEMKKQWKNLSRIMNIIFVAILIYWSMSYGNETTGSHGILTFIGVIVAIGVVYFIVYVFLVKIASYEALPVKADDLVDTENVVNRANNPEYTQEQIEIMEMYAEIEKKARSGEMQHSDDKQIQINEMRPELDPCFHKPARCWKNFIPSRYEFTCSRCGKIISFSKGQKKRMNMIFMLVVIIILMPLFTDSRINFWQFGLFSLLTLAISSIIQYVYIRRGHFEIKNVD